jgi:peptidoglycan/xylan/chitin deacetylase (PgdA/CDA1 family)
MLHGVGTPEFPADVFRAQLAFLNRFFRIVPLTDIWECETSNRQGRPRVALTFDDGLRNNFTVAYPALREFNAPATFFVCPGLVESQCWLWNHECRERLLWLPPKQRQQFGEYLGLGAVDVEATIVHLKYVSRSERLAAQKELRHLTVDFRPTDAQHKEFDIMTWNELTALDPKLITIGGHSANHEILTRLDFRQLESEVADCKSMLENKLGYKVRHFCYPDGAYDSVVRECVRHHYSSAVTTKSGWVVPHPSLLDLPRIPIAFNLADLAWRMHRPAA